MSEAIPFTVRLKFPANYQIPAHWHPAVERVTVLSGAVNMGVGDKLDMQQSMTLSPGSMIILQPKTKAVSFLLKKYSLLMPSTWFLVED